MAEESLHEEPVFLTLDEVREIHRQQIALFGGAAEVRDVRLLESAITQPRQQFGGEWLHSDLAAMAGAYLYHIVQNHPFVDGNKRVGTLCAYVFLGMNGFDVAYDLEETEQLVLGVADGKIAKEAVADFFRKLLKE